MLLSCSGKYIIELLIYVHIMFSEYNYIDYIYIYYIYMLKRFISVAYIVLRTVT